MTGTGDHEDDGEHRDHTPSVASYHDDGVRQRGTEP